MPSFHSSLVLSFLFLTALEASFVAPLRLHKPDPSRRLRRSTAQPYAPDGLNAGVYQNTLKSTCKIPQVTKVITVDTPVEVAAGKTFDCKLAKYQRADKSCNLDRERGGDQAVFVLQEGATLKNCILGYSQESVYCRGTCQVENCHWLQICDEAIAFYMPSGQATVTGCSFSNAGNKALQFNGGGTVNVNNSCFNNVDIAYRSCGKKCSTAKRAVVFTNNIIDGVNTFAGYNHQHGDTAHISGSSGKAIKYMCEAKDSGTPKGQTPPGCTLA
ncbi:pectate lyase-domain-containing protein [Melampsora americana]|nr:pectate lyase-domain-containing protein [Melampsora americana]